MKKFWEDSKTKKYQFKMNKIKSNRNKIQLKYNKI